MLDSVIKPVEAIVPVHDPLDPAQRRGAADMPVVSERCAQARTGGSTPSPSTRADALEIPPERAIAVGLIGNEPVTESVEHAFDERDGSVSVGLQVGPNAGRAELTVADDGRGVKPAAKARVEEEAGAGVRLRDALAHRIGGKIVRGSSSAGTSTRVRFSVAG